MDYVYVCVSEREWGGCRCGSTTLNARQRYHSGALHWNYFHKRNSCVCFALFTTLALLCFISCAPCPLGFLFDVIHVMQN